MIKFTNCDIIIMILMISIILSVDYFFIDKFRNKRNGSFYIGTLMGLPLGMLISWIIKLFEKI